MRKLSWLSLTVVAALEAVRSGSFKVAARIGSTPPVSGSIQLTELRLTLRRDPPPP